MFLTYLLISLFVYVCLFGITYLYSINYSKQVNLRLSTIKNSKLIHPSKFFVLLMFGLLILTVLINIFPIVSIKDTVVNKTNSSHYTLQSNDYYTDFFAIDLMNDYDISYNDDGKYVIAFSNDRNIYGTVNEVLDSPFTLYSRIVLFDQYDNIVWDTQNLSLNNYDLVYDNHRMDARAIEFLNDGNIAVFGLSIDLDTNIVYQTIVILDIDGNLIELIDLDISDYGFSQWGGHDYYDIVSTDEGFTIEYDITFVGSVMVNFNEHYDEQWHLINDENIDGFIHDGLQELYLDTLIYKNDIYYMLNNNTIKAYDSSGTLIWETLHDQLITGFDVFDDEIIVLSTSSEAYVERESLFKLKDHMKNTFGIDVVRMDPQTGEIKDTYAYQYHLFENENERLIIRGHYTLKDDLGNYYVLAHNIPSSHSYSDDPVYALIKFDSNFKYIGFNTMHIENMNSYELLRLFYKTSNYIENDLLYINGVLVSNRAIIDLNGLNYSEKNMNINIDFYNILLKVRVYFINVMLYVLIGFIMIIFPIYSYFSKSDDEEYIDEDLLREKYGNP